MHGRPTISWLRLSLAVRRARWTPPARSVICRVTCQLDASYGRGQRVERRGGGFEWFDQASARTLKPGRDDRERRARTFV